LAGLGDVATVDPDLVEWNYGAYEGRTTAEIHKDRPDWQLFRDGCPGGESLNAVGERADRVLSRIRDIDGDVVLFSHGHILRVLGARWIGLDAAGGRLLMLSTASLSALGHEHSKADSAIRTWNDVNHVVP
jgi:probable phosphoglycerate mutase